MDSLIHVPESLSIAVHAMVYLASKYPAAVSQPEFANTFRFSLAHVTKIMQVLRTNGLIGSIRGPTGGYALLKSPKEIMLINILEALNRNNKIQECLLECPACPSARCSLGRIVVKMEREFLAYLTSTSLFSLAQSAGFSCEHEKDH